MTTLLAVLMTLSLGAQPPKPIASVNSDGLPPKIGFVDWSRLLNEYRKNQDRRTTLQGQREEAKRLVFEKEVSVKRLTEELQLLKKNTEYYFSKRQELMDVASSLRLFKERTQAELVQHEVRINTEIYRDVQSAIRRFAVQNRYVGIFRLEQDPSRIEDPEIQAYRMSTMLLFYADPEADVTTQIVEVLNQEYGKTSTVPPAPASVPVPSGSLPVRSTTEGNDLRHQDGNDASSLEIGANPRGDMGRAERDDDNWAAQPARPREAAPDAEPQSALPSGDDTATLMKQLLRENRLLNERLARLETALQSNLVALLDKVNEIDGRANELTAGYVASRTSQVAGSVQGRILWDGGELGNCSVKLVHIPTGNMLDALATVFDVGIKPEKRRTQFVGVTNERGIFTFEEIPIGPYKLHWRLRNSRSWVRRLRNQPDVVVEAGILVYCSDVEANIRALN